MKRLIPDYINILDGLADEGDYIEIFGIAGMLQRIDPSHPKCREVFNKLKDKNNGDAFAFAQYDFEVDIPVTGLKFVREIAGLQHMGHPQAGHTLDQLDRLCAAAFWLDRAETLHPTIKRVLDDVRANPRKWEPVIPTAKRILCEAPPRQGDPSKALWFAISAVHVKIDRIQEVKDRIKRAVLHAENTSQRLVEERAILMGELTLMSDRHWSLAFESVMLELIDFAERLIDVWHTAKTGEKRKVLDEIILSMKLTLMPGPLTPEQMEEAVAGAKKKLKEQEELPRPTMNWGVPFEGMMIQPEQAEIDRLKENGNDD